MTKLEIFAVLLVISLYYICGVLSAVMAFLTLYGNVKAEEWLAAGFSFMVFAAGLAVIQMARLETKKFFDRKR